MAVGVRNWPLSNSLWIFFTTTGVAAGGGGGGGGGGGATRNVISCCRGNASVKIKGNNTRTPIRQIWSTNEIRVVAPCLVLSLPPILRGCLQTWPVLRRTLRLLRHRVSVFCSHKPQAVASQLRNLRHLARASRRPPQTGEPKYTPRKLVRHQTATHILVYARTAPPTP